jgi:hypothetical protein
MQPFNITRKGSQIKLKLNSLGQILLLKRKLLSQFIYLKNDGPKSVIPYTKVKSESLLRLDS